MKRLAPLVMLCGSALGCNLCLLRSAATHLQPLVPRTTSRMPGGGGAHALLPAHGCAGAVLPALATALATAPAPALATEPVNVLAADVTPQNNDGALLASLAAFFVLVLVDSGRAPVDPEREPELANFAETRDGEVVPASLDDARQDITQAFAYILLRGYKRAISPNLPKNCRFTPTCSEYTALAIREHGFPKGFVLFLWRLLRCNPAGGKGYDYPCWPPPAFNAGTTSPSVDEVEDDNSAG